MAGKYKETVLIIKQEEIAHQVYSVWLKTKEISKEAKAGQFVSVYCHDGSRLLPRPISLCEVDFENGTIRLVYRIAGKGTEEFSKLKAGNSIEILGPLGNGFVLPNDKKRVLLIGGGIGIPPMLQLAKNCNCNPHIVAGYRDELFLTEDLEQYGTLYCATEDGSSGTKGTVLDAIKENHIEADVIYACGPTPMLRAIKEYGQKNKIETWISLEEKMACGIGACLACVCNTKEVDEHSKVKNTRVCKEGPVFLAEEVEL